MKPGNKVYRVTKDLDGKWYFCVYELIKISHFRDGTGGCVVLAPILTYYNVNYKARSTFAIGRTDLNYLDDWVRNWDYLSTDEQKAISIYKEKINDETSNKR